jgi:hypothetical protein
MRGFRRRNSIQQGRNGMLDRELVFNDDGDFSKSEGDEEYFDDGSSSSSVDDGDLPAKATDYSMVTRAHLARQWRNAREWRSNNDDQAGAAIGGLSPLVGEQQPSSSGVQAGQLAWNWGG